jgi:hypothetical protein
MKCLPDLYVPIVTSAGWRCRIISIITQSSTLAQTSDILGGLHGNTQVPKLLGSLMRYIYAGEKIRRRGSYFLLGCRRVASQLRDRRS